jgi:transposase-like protein
MQEQSTLVVGSSSRLWEQVEELVREHLQWFIRSLVEEEVTELLGRKKSARRTAGDAPQRSRNGHGKPRRLARMSGTITVRRPRMRGLAEWFVSRVLSLFQRRTLQVSELLPRCTGRASR